MKKIFYIVLCAILIFVSWAQPATAIAVVDDLAAAAIAVLAALGLTFVFAGLSKSGALNHIGELLEEYAGSIGESLSDWLVNYNITMFGGRLRLAAALASKLYDFARWLKDKYSITDNTITNIISNAGGQGFLLEDGSIFKVGIVTLVNGNSAAVNDLSDFSILSIGADDIIFKSGARMGYRSGWGFVFISPDGNQVAWTTISSDSLGFTIGRVDKTGEIRFFPFEIRQGVWPGYKYYLPNVSSTNLAPYLGEYISVDGQTVGVDAGIIDIPVDDAVDDVLVDAGTIPIGTTVEGFTDIIIDDALAGTLDVSIEETADLPPVVQPDDVGDYTIDLTTFFPFCIPFDVYDAITMFNAEPQAPNFRLGMEWRGSEYGFDIDLSGFDDLAELLRRLEVIAFIVGLAIATRKFIKW